MKYMEDTKKEMRTKKEGKETRGNAVRFSIHTHYKMPKNVFTNFVNVQ